MELAPVFRHISSANLLRRAIICQILILIAPTEDDEDSQAKHLQFPLHTSRNIAHNFPPTRLELLFLLFTHCAKSYFAQEERLPTAPNR